jgi:hypothetical protein
MQKYAISTAAPGIIGYSNVIQFWLFCQWSWNIKHLQFKNFMHLFNEE